LYKGEKMSAMTRKGDALSGHGCWGGHVIAEGSGNVLVNGIPAARANDSSTPHTCPAIPETHSGVMVGSNSVYVNGRSAQKVGDGVSCGSTQASGSNNVFIGG
jgi:uncharacterized Zn-binding protein involved in type VI secretion